MPSIAVNKIHKTQLIQNYINPNSCTTNHLFKSSNPSITNSLFNPLTSRTNPLLNPLFSKKINITTRNNPQLNTYTVPIKKRHRVPNKKTESTTTPDETNTIATKIKETSNLGQEQQPLSEKEHYNPHPEIDFDNP